MKLINCAVRKIFYAKLNKNVLRTLRRKKKKVSDVKQMRINDVKKKKVKRIIMREHRVLMAMTP